MAFWSQPSLSEPKRAFRFLLSLPGTSRTGVPSFLVKKVKKPGFEVTESEHNFLNHTFYYPGKVKWKEVTFEIVDALSPNGARILMELLQTAGYLAPQQGMDDTQQTITLSPELGGGEVKLTQTVSKVNSIKALGKPVIRQLDANGCILEEWHLFNAWVKDVEFGELDYTSEELMSVAVTLRYDWAALKSTETITTDKDSQESGKEITTTFPTNASIKGS